MANREEIIEALKKIIDPELYLDIWTLGLIYDIKLEGEKLEIEMTFTSVGCPAGPYLVEEVKTKTEALPGIANTQVKIVFNPPWQPSEELKALLGIG